VRKEKRTFYVAVWVTRWDPTQLVLELPIDQSLTLTRKQNNGKNSENCRTE